jgi:hypothetical protein
VIPIVNKRTGERRALVIELDDEQQADVVRQIERLAVQRGFPPLERAYAMRRAAEWVPPGHDVVDAELCRLDEYLARSQ